MSSERDSECLLENPEMTFPIKKRIITELFVERTAAFFIGETKIRDTINEGIYFGTLHPFCHNKISLYIYLITL